MSITLEPSIINKQKNKKQKLTKKSSQTGQAAGRINLKAQKKKHR
jgi:hypothetical protein